jgi:Ca2+/Na+ antiporter
MPANKKHLTKSKSQRFAKISAGMLGGYMVTESLHIALAFWVNHLVVLMTLRFGGFILWVGLLILAFLAKNGWKVWGLYLLLTLFFCLLIYLGKIYNPII